jgi:competence protein ComEC
MRRLATYPHLVVTAALALGLACGPTPKIALVAAPLVAVGLAAGRNARRVVLIAAIALLVGVGAGAARVTAIDATARLVEPGEHVDGHAVLVERPRTSRFGSSAVLELQSNGARVLARAPARVRWPSGGDPGTVVAVRGTARTPRRSATSDFDWPAYLARRGIRVELSLDDLRPTDMRRGGLPGGIDTMRRRAERAISNGLAEPKEALARGMVLGEDEAISDPVREDFRASGLAHLLAVSGQNVMLLGALALPLLAAAGAGPRGRALTLLGLIAVYVPLAGAGPSLQRAGAMGAAGAIALAAGRVSSRWYALLLAAAVTLAANPRAAGDPGWQLSFVAVAGILLLGAPLRGAVAGLPRPLAEGVAITVAATVSTAPLVAHHFGTVSAAGLVANLLALPAVAPIMWLGMTAAALAQLPAAAPLLAGPVDVVTHALAAVDGVLLGYLGWLARLLAEAPGATMALPLRSTGAVIGAYVAIAAAAYAVRRSASRAEPWVTTARAAFRRSPARLRIAAVATALALAALALASWTATPAPPGDLTVSFLDIGQGDATLIQAPDGAAVLFDGGPPEGRVTTLLKRAGVRRLSLVVMTHQSRDHHAGLQAVVDRFPVDTLLENGDGTPDRSFWRVVDSARARGARVVEPHPGQTLTVGGLRIHVYGPPPRAPGPAPEDPNPRAIPAVVSYGDFDLFLSGDAESDALAQYPDLPDVDAMKVSHHGSADPGLPRLLARLRPQVAAIEVGEGNSYGHPTPSTLAALHAAVPRVYRTDQDGTVTLTVREGRMTADTAR